VTNILPLQSFLLLLAVVALAVHKHLEAMKVVLVVVVLAV
jgi:hypothetical protein